MTIQTSMDAINQTDYGVLLLAYGNPAYLKAAKVLRRCLKIHSPNIPCALATSQYKQQSLKHYFDYIIPIKNKRQGYLEKIYINTYSPFKRTLYLDANSLVFKDISKIFTLLKGNPFTHLSGNIRFIGDPLLAKYKDKESLEICMRYYQIKQIHRFNGGVYYFEKCPKSTVFFQQAQKISTPPPHSYPTINDDEIIYGITNERTKIAVVYPNKDIAQSIVDVTDENICVLKRECAIFKKHQWQNPTILCFNSGSLKSLNFFHLVYLREKLKLSSNKNIADFLYTSKLIILFIPWIPVLTHYFKKTVKFILGAKMAKKIKELAG